MLKLYDRRDLFICVLILLLACAVGVQGLNSDSLWLDEYWSISHAGGAYLGPLTAAGVWDRIATTDPWQAPFYYMLLNLWGGLVGWTEFAARSLSLLVGIMAIAFTYRLGRDLQTRRAGLAAAALMGTSAYFLYFFHELRAYTLYVFFTPLIVWAYWRLMTRKAGVGFYVLLFAASLGALYTHYFAALTLVAVGLYHLFTIRSGLLANRRVWWRVTGVLALVGLAFIPWMSVLLRGIAQASSEVAVRGIGALTNDEAVRGLLHLFSNGSTLLLIGLCLFGVVRSRVVMFTWLWAAVVLVILLMVNAWLGVLLEVRYMLALWPALAILAGFGLDRLYRQSRRWAAGVLAVWMVGGLWVSFDPTASLALSNPHWHLPWRELRSELRPRHDAGDSVFFLLPDWTWAVYHRVGQDYYLRDLPVTAALVEQPGHVSYATYVTQAREGIRPANRVWLAADPTQPLTHRREFITVLDEFGYQACANFGDGQRLDLDLFGRLPDDTTVLRWDIGAGLDILPLTPLPESATGVLSLAHFFASESPEALSRYSFSIHLSSAAGELAAQVDYGVPPQTESCRAVDIALNDLPPGQYDVLVVVYNWESGERILPVDAEIFSTTPDNRTLIGTIQINP